MDAKERGTRSSSDFYSEEWHQVVAVARQITLDPDSAEDIAQEAFLRVWHHWSASPKAAQGVAFARRIARNLALNRQRNKLRRARLAHRVVGKKVATSPLEDVLSKEASDFLSAAIATLPPRQRQIVDLMLVRGFSVQEIAKMLERSPQTIANQASRARAKLRSVYRDIEDW